jgi:hypothetical protein
MARAKKSPAEYAGANTVRSDRATAAASAAWVAYHDAASQIVGDSAMLAHYQAAHPLWTPEMAAVLPTDSEVGSAHDPICYFRFVAPHRGDCEWLILSATPRADDVIFMGWCCLGDEQNAEVGDVSLKELREIRGPFFLNVELDQFFTPVPLSQVNGRRGRSLRAAR